MTPTGSTTVTIETENGTTTGTSPRALWTTVLNLEMKWAAIGWRYSVRDDDDTVTLTRYNDDGTIDRRITLTEEVAW